MLLSVIIHRDKNLKIKSEIKKNVSDKNNELIFIVWNKESGA